MNQEHTTGARYTVVIRDSNGDRYGTRHKTYQEAVKFMNTVGGIDRYVGVVWFDIKDESRWVMLNTAHIVSVTLEPA